MAVVAEVSDVAHVPLFYNYFRFFNISHYFSEVSLQNLKKNAVHSESFSESERSAGEKQASYHQFS